MPKGIYERTKRAYSCERLAQIVAMGRANRRHGNSVGYCVTPTYHTWRSMIQRCTNPRRRNYRWYGARGIRVCDRWRESFAAFLSDMGERPQGKTIDRFPDKNGDYEVGNCRWATQKEQCANRRRIVIPVLER